MPQAEGVVNISEEDLHFLAAHVQQQEEDLALERLRAADAEVEVKDLKRLLQQRTKELETLQKRMAADEVSGRRRRRSQRKDEEDLEAYCKELESIVDVLEEETRRRAEDYTGAVMQAAAAQERLGRVTAYASKLEAKLWDTGAACTDTPSLTARSDVDQDYKLDSPLAPDRVEAHMLASMSPPRTGRRRPALKSVGTQTGVEGSCSARSKTSRRRNRNAPQERASDGAGEDVLELRMALRESKRELEEGMRSRCGEHESQIIALKADLLSVRARADESRLQLDELRGLLRSAKHGRGGDSLCHDADDEVSLDSADSRLLRSRKWLTDKVTELKRKLPPVAIHSNANKIVPLGDERELQLSTGRSDLTASSRSLN